MHATNNQEPGHPAMPAAALLRPIPSFLIVGPPRTGTSWLHEILRERALLPRSTKETRFFDTHFHRGLTWYNAHYARSMGDRPVGEVAPTYFSSVEARERIARTIPDARVVCIFRNPVDRVVSLYRVKRAYGMIPWSFEQSLCRDPELIESSRYATNLKAWQLTMGASRVLATFYDDLRDHSQSYVDSLADFIKLPRFILTQSQIKRVFSSETMTHPRNYHRTRRATAMANWFKAWRFDPLVTAVRESPFMKLLVGGGPTFAELTPELSVRLYQLFRPEVEALEAMLNRDLSQWKSLNAHVESARAGA